MPRTDALAPLATRGASMTYREVEELLVTAGWSPCDAGDWAFALVSPEGDLVARISPFDPVGPFTARLYEQAVGTGSVPRLHLHRRLTGGADLQVMERLFPVDEATVTEFLERFGRPEPELAGLAATVGRVHEEATQQLPWCGPLDTNPSNIMRAADGHLVMIDPYYADGPHLYAMAREDPDRFVTTLPEQERRHLTEIPLTDSGPWPAEEREAMAEAVRQADARRTEALRAGATPTGASPADALRADAPRAADRLIAEAAVADVDGWGFSFLDGRATEERPPWGYLGLLADAVARAEVAVDLDTGGGEVLGKCPRLAAH